MSRVISNVWHGKRVKIHDGPGVVASCWRKARPYEHLLLEDAWNVLQERPGACIDVGANVGNHTLWFAGVCGMPTVAFEPLQTARLIENLRLNPDAPVAVAGWALGAQTGQCIHQGKGVLGQKADRVDGPDRAAGVDVRVGQHVGVRRLDDVSPLDYYAYVSASLSDHDAADLSVLKVDVEGMEAEVFKGGRETIERWQPVIYAEAWDDAHQVRISQVLQPLGYRLAGRIQPPNTYRWDPA